MSQYTMSYKQLDFGTERILTVYRDGKPIGHRDPFPHGVPVEPARRKRMMHDAALRIIADAL
jgi:hypothetical protein